MSSDKKSSVFLLMLQRLISILFSKENFLALVLALILISIFIATASDSPTWIYQGF